MGTVARVESPTMSARYCASLSERSSWWTRGRAEAALRQRAEGGAGGLQAEGGAGGQQAEGGE